MQVGGRPGIPAAVGGLGELKMGIVAVVVFTRQVLALPITLRPLKPRGEGAPVERELCALGPRL